MKRFATLFFVGAGASLCTSIAEAGPIGLTGIDQTYTQDFDSLAGLDEFQDDTTIPGWFVDGSGNSFDAPGTVLSMNDAPGGGLFHAGTATDRAFGFRNSNTPGNWFKGVQFENTSVEAVTYDQIDVSLVVEQWQNRTGNDEQVALAYKITASSGNILNSSGWIEIDSATIDITGAGGAVDGNLPANQTNLSGVINDVTLASGEFITFRYFDINVTGSGALGNDNALAIDDFEVTLTVPEPGSVSLAVIGVGCLLFRRR